MRFISNNNRKAKYEPYQELANAIILQAVSDYRKALKCDARGVKRECVRFFRSEWFNSLTNLNGEMLIQKLKAEVM